MGNRRLRKRLARLALSKTLTDHEADAILACQKYVNEGLRWRKNSAGWTVLDIPVSNVLLENLKMTGKINPAYPGKSSWTLTWGDKSQDESPEAIRRLDLRANHRNPDGEKWALATHKHRWTSENKDSWAYTPDDIPHDLTASIVVPDDYRQVFEAFAGECGITLGDGYEWQDPDLTVEPETTTWEVP